MHIRNAEREELSFFIQSAKEEGWNPGLEDAKAFFATDPKGFFVGELEGEIIGCISGVAYNSTFGFLGFYIVKPKYRGKGYGIQLWKHTLNYLGNRSIGLDGVISQQHNYRKSGFKLYYRNMRMEGAGGGKAPKDLIDIHQIPFGELAAYDHSIFGMDRAIFLKHWLAMSNATGFAVKQNQILNGYGIVRKCYQGFKIGPLFADTFEIAHAIYQGLRSKVGDAALFLDIPETNEEALQLSKIYSMKKVFETARMYNREPPEFDVKKIFGITTFELG